MEFFKKRARRRSSSSSSNVESLINLTINTETSQHLDKLKRITERIINEIFLFYKLIGNFNQKQINDISNDLSDTGGISNNSFSVKSWLWEDKLRLFINHIQKKEELEKLIGRVIGKMRRVEEDEELVFLDYVGEFATSANSFVKREAKLEWKKRYSLLSISKKYNDEAEGLWIEECFNLQTNTKNFSNIFCQKWREKEFEEIEHLKKIEKSKIIAQSLAKETLGEANDYFNLGINFSALDEGKVDSEKEISNWENKINSLVREAFFQRIEEKKEVIKESFSEGKCKKLEANKITLEYLKKIEEIEEEVKKKEHKIEEILIEIDKEILLLPINLEIIDEKKRKLKKLVTKQVNEGYLLVKLQEKSRTFLDAEKKIEELRDLIKNEQKRRTLEEIKNLLLEKREGYGIIIEEKEINDALSDNYKNLIENAKKVLPVRKIINKAIEGIFAEKIGKKIEKIKGLLKTEEDDLYKEDPYEIEKNIELLSSYFSEETIKHFLLDKKGIENLKKKLSYFITFYKELDELLTFKINTQIPSERKIEETKRSLAVWMEDDDNKTIRKKIINLRKREIQKKEIELDVILIEIKKENDRKNAFLIASTFNNNIKFLIGAVGIILIVILISLNYISSYFVKFSALKSKKNTLGTN